VATKDLFDQVLKMIEDKGLEGKLNVAWVEGDIVTDVINAVDSSTQISVCTGQKLSDWPHTPLFAQCYLGGWAIAKALEAGADIVICGRVADASPIIGAATWWHNWKRTDFDYLAQTLIAGHLIECKITSRNILKIGIPQSGSMQNTLPVTWRIRRRLTMLQAQIT
jgi:hypothetical protein